MAEKDNGLTLFNRQYVAHETILTKMLKKTFRGLFDVGNGKRGVPFPPFYMDSNVLENGGPSTERTQHIEQWCMSTSCWFHLVTISTQKDTVVKRASNG